MVISQHHRYKLRSFAAVLQLIGRFFDVQGNLGWINALKLFLGHRFCSEFTLKLPGLKGPLYLRGGGSDAFVFRKVFLLEDYFIPGQNPRFIIDAGANIGISAVYFANLYPEATIFCVEPESANIQQFLKNTRPYPNIKLFSGALWSRTTSLAIANPEAHSAGFVVREQVRVTEHAIPAFSISDLLAQAPAEQVDILKIDIEGSESRVFGENPDPWLARVKVIMIELHENKAPGCGQAFFSATTRQPFQYHMRGENMVLTRNNGEKAVCY
jgi:FkbM family methyltransferase